MKQTKILLGDGSALGQPKSVLRLWESAFKMKGIEYYDKKPLPESGLSLDSLVDYAVIVLSSLPGLASANIARLKAYAENGGQIIASGPMGDLAGPSRAFCELMGVEIMDDMKAPGPVVPLLHTLIDPFQRGDLLLFLQDYGPVPALKSTRAQTYGGSLIWNHSSAQFVKCGLPTVLHNQVGSGAVTYLTVALGDEQRIPPQRANEYIPGGNAPGATTKGHPYYSSLHAATLSFMMALITSTRLRYAGTGHWPNGWRIAITLSGDVHELDQYVNFQGGAALKMAEFLKSEDLDGLFTFSVTGEALDEEPELYKDLVKHGYEVVPHSTYESTLMNELSEQESLKEIDKCFDAFKRHLPSESLLGWRSHGWSGNDYIERQLNDKGVTWLSNLILHRYGEFGPRDQYVQEGMGIAFICLPEKAGELTIVRLPNTYFSPDWVRTLIMGAHYGIARGPELDDVMYDFMKRRFYKDWRFEALHMVCWHPWEEFVEEPIFDRAVRDLVALFKKTQHVGLINPTELTQWWNYRQGIRIKELSTDGLITEITVTIPRSLVSWNPTIRITPANWQISSVRINNEIEWCFYSPGWVALPSTLEGEARITIRMGRRPSSLPIIRDTSALVTTAEVKNNKVFIELEEKRRDIGILTLYVPRTVEGELDGTKLTQPLMGHVAIPLAKGKHRLLLTPLMRTTVNRNKGP